VGERGSRDRELAARFIGADWRPVLEQCGRDRTLAASVSRAVAEELRNRVSAVPVARRREDLIWTEIQGRLVELASQSGADQTALAEALFDAITGQLTVGAQAPQLSRETLRWLLGTVHERIDALVDLGPLSGPTDTGAVVNNGPILDALWELPGEEGAEWLVKMIPSSSEFLSGSIQRMSVGELDPWSAEDWNSRLSRISDECGELPNFLTFIKMARPPAGTAAAQVRLVCRFATGADDQLLRDVAENLSGYVSGDPGRDVDLFSWHEAQQTPGTFLWLLELSGPPSYRAQLVARARDRGLIDADTAELLTQEVERPDWADGEVPWQVSMAVDAGAVSAPEGEIAGGSPWANLDTNPAFVFEVEPGDYSVRLIVASHPLLGSENGAAELRISDAAVVDWKPIVAKVNGAAGYVAEAGVAAFGSPRAFRLFADELPEELLPTTEARHTLFDEPEPGVGNIVAFTVGPQDQQCRSWLGVDADGRPAAVVTDLGLLEDVLGTLT
jgi:hypothetical protein